MKVEIPDEALTLEEMLQYIRDNLHQIYIHAHEPHKVKWYVRDAVKALKEILETEWELD